MPNLNQCFFSNDWLVHLHDDRNRPHTVFCSLFVYHQCQPGVIHRSTYATHYPHFRCLYCEKQLDQTTADTLYAAWVLNKRTTPKYPI